MIKPPQNRTHLADWLDWLTLQHPQEIDLGLARVGEVAARLDVCRPAPFVITVAGTNGKGSSVAMLVAILKAQGYRVGAYTSPHLVRFNERIELNEGFASDEQLVSAFERIYQACQTITLTYFEYATLAALWLFKQQALDVVILEVGLGGRLDAVNLVDADATLITAIDIDHSDWLGSDREVIGFEKAGVMRAGQVSICSDPNPPKSVPQHAALLGIALRCLGRDYDFSVFAEHWVFREASRSIELPLPALMGAFQLQNAAGVVALLVTQKRLNVEQAAIADGLRQVRHPGRLQSMKLGRQNWLFDVAHNPQSVAALAEFKAHVTSNKPCTAIFGVMADKDVCVMITHMMPYIETWILPDLAMSRAMSPQTLQRHLIEQGVARSNIQLTATMAQAVATAKFSADDVLVYGSFITVSQALEAVSWMK